MFALALFVVATALAFVAPWLGFGCICLALILHLIPDASRLGARKRFA
jgi:hypothetical protein